MDSARRIREVISRLLEPFASVRRKKNTFKIILMCMKNYSEDIFEQYVLSGWR